jgi:phage baseplate assembly protein W
MSQTQTAASVQTSFATPAAARPSLAAQAEAQGITDAAQADLWAYRDAALAADFPEADAVPPFLANVFPAWWKSLGKFRMRSKMHRETSDFLDDEQEHIKQSIIKIITTPVGSRVMRRDYGRLIPKLINAPINDRVRLQVVVVAATAAAEPRIRPTRVLLQINGPSMTIELTATMASGPTAGRPFLMLVPLK